MTQTVEEQNKATINRIFQAINERDRKAFDACYADEVVAYHAHGGSETLDHDAHWEVMERIFEIFPDYTETLLGMMAEGDRVFIYWRNAGTHLTGIHAEWHGFSDYRLKDGKIVEGWQIHDLLSLYEQLGLVERPKG